MQVAKTKGLSAILTSEGRSLLRTLRIEYGIFLMSNDIKGKVPHLYFEPSRIPKTEQ